MLSDPRSGAPDPGGQRQRVCMLNSTTITGVLGSEEIGYFNAKL